MTSRIFTKATWTLALVLFLGSLLIRRYDGLVTRSTAYTRDTYYLYTHGSFLTLKYHDLAGFPDGLEHVRIARLALSLALILVLALGLQHLPRLTWQAATRLARRVRSIPGKLVMRTLAWCGGAALACVVLVALFFPVLKCDDWTGWSPTGQTCQCQGLKIYLDHSLPTDGRDLSLCLGLKTVATPGAR